MRSDVLTPHKLSLRQVLVKPRAFPTLFLGWDNSAMPKDASHADTPYARRLAALMKSLGMNAAEFSVATGLTQDYVSKVYNGELGLSGRPLQRLHRAAEKAFGVADIYWTSASDKKPETAYDSRSQPKGGLMGVIVGAQVFGGQRPVDAGGNRHGPVKAALAQYAADRGLSDHMVVAIHKLSPPEDADLVWWIGTWTDLLITHPPQSSRAT